MRSDRTSRWLPGSGVVLLVAALAAAPVAGAGPAGLGERLPRPDVATLEPAVAAQLERLDEVTRAVLTESDDPAVRAEAVGELGRHYHAYGLAAPAETCYRLAAELAPEDFRWPYHLGYLLDQSGRAEEAAKEYERALAIVPRVPPALVRLARLYVQLDRPEAAEWALKQALELDDANPAAEATLGELRVAQGRHAEGIALLEAALDKEPAANRLYYPLALAYRARGEVDRARELLEQKGEVGLRPADPLLDALPKLTTGSRVELLRGQAAYRAGRFAEAAEAFRRAVAADPGGIPARVNLGSALGALGDVDGAIAAFREVVELAPANDTALYNLGVLLARQGRVEEAVEALAQAAQYAPADAAIRVELAAALGRAGRAQEALLHYREAIARDPAALGARLDEAQILIDLGRYGEARARLEEGVALAPGSGGLTFALARLLAVNPRAELRDGERALELAGRVWQARGSLRDAETVALALAELGRCDEAAEWQRRALELAPASDAALRDTLGEGLRRYEAGAPCASPAEAAGTAASRAAG